MTFVPQDDYSDIECPLCLEPFDSPVEALPCKHVFCQRCLADVPTPTLPLCPHPRDYDRKCPVCRQYITTSAAAPESLQKQAALIEGHCEGCVVVLPRHRPSRLDSDSPEVLEPPSRSHALDELSPDALEEEKQALGEELYIKIQEVNPHQAPKITGMLLEMDIPEILNVLEDRDMLIVKVLEAVSVLQFHRSGNGNQGDGDSGPAAESTTAGPGEPNRSEPRETDSSPQPPPPCARPGVYGQVSDHAPPQGGSSDQSDPGEIGPCTWTGTRAEFAQHLKQVPHRAENSEIQTLDDDDERFQEIIVAQLGSMIVESPDEAFALMDEFARNRRDRIDGWGESLDEDLHLAMSHPRVRELMPDGYDDDNDSNTSYFSGYSYDSNGAAVLY